MPLEYEIDDKLDLIYVYASGKLQVDEYRDFFERLRDDPRRRRSMHMLSDYRQIELSASAEDVRTIASLMGSSQLFRECRNAVIASQAASFGLARMFEMLTEPSGIEIRTFDTPAAAISWLDKEGAAAQKRRDPSGSIDPT